MVAQKSTWAPLGHITLELKNPVCAGDRDRGANPGGKSCVSWTVSDVLQSDRGELRVRGTMTNGLGRQDGGAADFSGNDTRNSQYYLRGRLS